MSVSKQSSYRAKALKQFLKGLPDAKICNQSTIKEEVLVENETITLLAQKAKGIDGMTWRVSHN